MENVLFGKREKREGGRRGREGGEGGKGGRRGREKREGGWEKRLGERPKVGERVGIDRKGRVTSIKHVHVFLIGPQLVHSVTQLKL